MNRYRIVIVNKYNSEEVIATIERMGNSEEEVLNDMDILLGKNERVWSVAQIS